MAWVASLRGKVVGLDTTPVIYFIERHTLSVDMIRSFFEAVQQGECSVVTSTVTLLETLIVPFRHGDKYLARKYHNMLLKTKGLKVVPVSTEIAEEAARLRASFNIHRADFIQMATALSGGASFFLTNDSRLPSLPNLKVLVLDDLKKEAGS